MGDNKKEPVKYSKVSMRSILVLASGGESSSP